MKKWTTEWPTEEGDYWFYGYIHPYREASSAKPVLLAVRVKSSQADMFNLFFCDLDGMIIPGFYRHEIFGPYRFSKAVFPEVPNLKPTVREFINLKASDYKWDCPKCDEPNHTPEAKKEVSCSKCDAMFIVWNVFHSDYR